MPIRGVDHIDLAVTDVDRSLAFYLGMLGPIGLAVEARFRTYRGTEDVVYLGFGQDHVQGCPARDPTGPSEGRRRRTPLLRSEDRAPRLHGRRPERSRRRLSALSGYERPDPLPAKGEIGPPGLLRLLRLRSRWDSNRGLSLVPITCASSGTRGCISRLSRSRLARLGSAATRESCRTVACPSVRECLLTFPRRQCAATF